MDLLGAQPRSEELVGGYHTVLTAGEGQGAFVDHGPRVATILVRFME